MSQRTFLSFSSNDRGIADQLCETLETEGVPCWICHRDIVTGKSYAESLTQAIESAAAYVVIVTTSSLHSAHVRREIELAARQELWIFPLVIGEIKLEGDFEYFLSSLQLYRVSDPPGADELRKFSQQVSQALAGHVDRVADTFNRETPQQHDPLPKRGTRSQKPGHRTLLLCAAGILVCAAIGIWSLGSNSRDPLPKTTREVLNMIYRDSPGKEGQKTARMKVDVVLHPPHNSAPQRLTDRQQLVSNKDQYIINVEAETDGYLYVFQVDSAGKIDWLFPRNSSEFSTGSNPVSTSAIRIPADDKMFLSLNETVGYEHVYAVLTTNRWPALETLLQQAAHVPLETPAASPSPLAKGNRGIIRSPLELGVRGIGSVRPLDKDPADQSTSAGTLLVESLDGVVVIERVFEHISE